MSMKLSDIDAELARRLDTSLKAVATIRDQDISGLLDFEEDEPQVQQEKRKVLRQLQIKIKHEQEQLNILKEDLALAASHLPKNQENHKKVLGYALTVTVTQLDNALSKKDQTISKAFKEIKGIHEERTRIQRGEPAAKGWLQRFTEYLDDLASDVSEHEKEEMLKLMRREAELKKLKEDRDREHGIIKSSIQTAKELGSGSASLVGTAGNSVIGALLKALYTTATIPVTGPIKLINTMLKAGSELNRPNRNIGFRILGMIFKKAFDLWPNVDRLAEKHPIAWGAFALTFGVAFWAVFIVGTLGFGSITAATLLAGSGLGAAAKVGIDVRKEYRELRDARPDSADAVVLSDFRKQHPRIADELNTIVSKESQVVSSDNSAINASHASQPGLAKSSTTILPALGRELEQIKAKESGLAEASLMDNTHGKHGKPITTAAKVATDSASSHGRTSSVSSVASLDTKDTKDQKDKSEKTTPTHRSSS